MLCVHCVRIRHSSGHHGKGRTEQLAGQRHLRGKLQRCQLPPTAGRSRPAAREEVCHRPGGGEADEHAGTGDATATVMSARFMCHVTSNCAVQLFCGFTFFVDCLEDFPNAPLVQ